MMNQLFLKAKHWQLFLVDFGLPIIANLTMYILFMRSIMVSVMANQEPDPTVILNYLPFILIVSLISMFSLAGWIWAMSTGLQSQIPENIHLKIKKFKRFFFIPFVYVLFIAILVIANIGYITHPKSNPDFSNIGTLVLIIIPFHLLSIFSGFYTLYFAAKTYKTAELQKEVKFSDFAFEFILLWFYPIGIWILQPKINQMIKQ